MEDAAGGMAVDTSIAVALALTVVLAALHLLAPHMHRIPGLPERKAASFAGGTAVAYVFLHLLPELAAGNERVAEALGSGVEPTPLLELAVFGVGLAGFAAFYGLEELARTSGSHRDHALSGGGAPAAGGEAPSEDSDPPAAVFYLHLGSFFLYNALITYTLALRLRTGLMFALLFTVAMGLHFVLTDRTLQEHYPRRFQAYGRFLLAGGLGLGWVFAALFAPTSHTTVSLLTAALAGSVLLNVFKEELPSARQSSYGWFLFGVVFYAVLLAGTTALQAEEGGSLTSVARGS